MSNVKPVVGLRLGVLVDMGPGSVTGGTLAAFEAVKAHEFQILRLVSGDSYIFGNGPV